MVVSTLDLNAGDRRFLDRVKRFISPEPFLYLGQSAYDRISRGLDLSLNWDLARSNFIGTQPSDLQTESLSVLKTLDLGKQAVRLTMLSGQSAETQEAIDVCERYALFIRHLLTQLKPRLVLCLNPIIPHTQIPREVAESLGIQTLTFERGMLKGSHFLDTGGFGGHSELASVSLSSLIPAGTASAYQETWREFLNAHPDALASRNTTSTSSNVYPQDVPGKAISQVEGARVLFCPIADVNNAIFPEDHPERAVNLPHFQNSVETARELSRVVQGSLRIKPHPNEYHRYEPLRDELPVVFEDLEEQITWADVVVVNGSSLEAVCFARGKPVVQTGRTLLSGKGVFYEVNEVQSLSVCLKMAQEKENWPQRVRHFEALMGYLVETYFMWGQDDPHFETKCARRLPRRRTWQGFADWVLLSPRLALGTWSRKLAPKFYSPRSSTHRRVSAE